MVLVPWKPRALVVGRLTALILVSYFGSALICGKDPFAVNTGNWHPATAQHFTHHPTGKHKPSAAP